MFKVYLAAPLSVGDTAINVHKAMIAADQCIDAGINYFCPHYSHFQNIHKAKEYEVWMEMDFDWIRVCDILWRLPGDSPGGDREVKFALSLGIPVVYSFEELLDTLKMMRAHETKRDIPRRR